MTEVHDKNLLTKIMRSFDDKDSREEKEGDRQPNINTYLHAIITE